MSSSAWPPDCARNLAHSLAGADTYGVSAVGMASLLRQDQRRRWLRGERRTAEDYLAALPALRDQPETLLDLVYGEFVLRQEMGEAPSAEELVRRFPDHAAALERQLALHAALEGSSSASSLDTLSLPPTAVRGPDAGTMRPQAEAVQGEAVDEHARPLVPGYEILGMLGKGGMGVVYRARQAGLDRVVALKMILHAEHASRAEHERFQAEAEAFARLQHPNIVQVHEVGHNRGLPFFSLEYCGGGALGEKLDGTPWPADKAAALVEALAHGAHAAHRAGIVHRDLKPANVLFTDDGTPKITDFGLAKRMDSDGHTRTGAVLGTPSYMAPEQAEGKKDVGPLADVYSLGAILYELLTGRPPFKAATPMETLRQVVTDEPVPVRQLQSRSPRDLETICLKCLQKGPGNRYASALDLADDLGRFQRGEPIRARPIGRLERLVRWAQRSPWVAGLSAAVVLLAALVVLSTVAALVKINAAREQEAQAKDRALGLAAEKERIAQEEEKARQAADQERDRARTEALKARSVADALVGLFQASDPIGLQQSTFVSRRAVGEKLDAREILDRGAKRLQTEFKKEPAVRAALLAAIGGAYRSMGEYERAEPLLKEALCLREGADDLEQATTLTALGWLYRDQGAYDAALPLLRKALAIRERQGAGPALVAESQFHLGWLLGEMDEIEESEKLLRQSLALRQAHMGPEHREVAFTLFALAGVLLEAGRTTEAVPAVLSASRILRKAEGTGQLAEAVEKLQQGLAAKFAGQLWLAEPLLNQSLDLTKKVLGDRQIYLCLILHELADTVARRGADKQAEQYFRQCLDVARQTVGMGHTRVVIPVRTFAALLARQGRHAEAEELYCEMIESTRRQSGPDSPRVGAAVAACARFLSGDLPRALPLAAEADRLFRNGDTTHSRAFTIHLYEYAWMCFRAGRMDDTQRLALEAVPLLRRYYAGSNPLALAESLNLAAAARLRQGRYDGVASLIDEALSICDKQKDGAELTQVLYQNQGHLYRTQGKLAEAERACVRALELARRNDPKDAPSIAARASDLAEVLAMQAKYPEAAGRFAEAAALWDKAHPGGPEAIRAHCDAALAYLGAGDGMRYGQNSGWLRKHLATARSPLVPDMLAALVLRAEAVEDWPQVYQIGIKALPSQERVRDAIIRAGLACRAGHTDEAIRYLSAPRLFAGPDKTIALLWLALARQNSGELDAVRRALDDAQQAQATAPSDWREHVQLRVLNDQTKPRTYAFPRSNP